MMNVILPVAFLLQALATASATREGPHHQIQFGGGLVGTAAGIVGTGNFGQIWYYNVPGLGGQGSTFRFQVPQDQVFSSGGAFMIQGVHSGRCWNIGAESKAVGYPLSIYDCWTTTAANERFFVINGGDNWFYLVASHDGLCISTDGSRSNNAKVFQDTCAVNRAEMLWKFVETRPGSDQFYVINKATGMNVAVYGRQTANCWSCVLWETPNPLTPEQTAIGDNHMWRFTGTRT